MKYKVISMDFDGTLLTSDKKVSDKNKEALLKYKKNNYFIVGITARNISSVNNVCDINMFNYLILNNGAYIYDVENKEIINISNIDKDIAINITKYFEDASYQIDYCSLNNYYIYKNKNIENKSFLKRITSIEEVEEEIVRMNIFLKDNSEVDKYKEYIKKYFKNIDFFQMSDTDNKNDKKWLVLTSKGTNKLETLKILCSKLKISINEVVFFGDSSNDLLIIGKVGLGVAMGNALKEVKEQAKAITLSNDEDGIAYFLENDISLK